MTQWRHPYSAASWNPALCIKCQQRPIRRPLTDERGWQHTIGLTTCQECSGEQHAWGCNDPDAHDAPHACSRLSTRTPPARKGIIIPE